MWYILLVVCLEYIFASASCLREWGAFTGHLEMMTLLRVCVYVSKEGGMGFGELRVENGMGIRDRSEEMGLWRLED